MIVSENRDVDMYYSEHHDVVTSHVNKFKIVTHTIVEELDLENKPTLLRQFIV